MPRVQTTTRTLYKFNELSEAPRHPVWIGLRDEKDK